MFAKHGFMYLKSRVLGYNLGFEAFNHTLSIFFRYGTSPQVLRDQFLR